ncbi:MAG: hypothetical protein FWE62_01560 [Firmicutes bacterium]|nr:hypothetical protein [Bacillota bacterium]
MKFLKILLISGAIVAGVCAVTLLLGLIASKKPVGLVFDVRAESDSEAIAQDFASAKNKRVSIVVAEGFFIVEDGKTSARYFTEVENVGRAGAEGTDLPAAYLDTAAEKRVQMVLSVQAAGFDQFMELAAEIAERYSAHEAFYALGIKNKFTPDQYKRIREHIDNKIKILAYVSDADFGFAVSALKRDDVVLCEGRAAVKENRKANRKVLRKGGVAVWAEQASGADRLIYKI